MTMDTWQPAPVTRDVVDGWAVQLAGVAQLAEYIATTDFVPKAYRNQPAAVAAAILAGRELGIGPMTSLQHLYVVEGRPAISAQLMRALVLGAGHDLRVIESTSARCVVTGRRRGDSADREPVTWSAEEVRRAGLANRQTWQRYPRQMLLARATGELCRRDFPDVCGGLYTVEEAADIPEAGEPPEQPAPQRAARIVRRRPEAAPRQNLPGSAGDGAPAAPASGPKPLERPDLPPLPEDAGPDPEPAPLAPPAADVPAEEAEPGPLTPPAEPEPTEGRTAEPEPDEHLSSRQQGHLFALLGELGAMHPRARRLHTVSALVGRPLESMAQLTRAEATPLIDVLVRIREADDPSAELDWLVSEGAGRLQDALPIEVEP